MALLSKQQVFAAKDAETVVVDIPEWNDQVPEGEVAQVTIARMSGDAKDRWEASCVGKNGGPNFVNLRAKLVSSVVVDENGDLMFDEKEVVKLGKKSAKALDRIIDAAERLNKLGNKDYEELAKN